MSPSSVSPKAPAPRWDAGCSTMPDGWCLALLWRHTPHDLLRTKVPTASLILRLRPLQAIWRQCGS
jgi:hypothetical protein